MSSMPKVSRTLMSAAIIAGASLALSGINPALAATPASNSTSAPKARKVVTHASVEVGGKTVENRRESGSGLALQHVRIRVLFVACSIGTRNPNWIFYRATAEWPAHTSLNKLQPKKLLKLLRKLCPVLLVDHVYALSHIGTGISPETQ